MDKLLKRVGFVNKHLSKTQNSTIKTKVEDTATRRERNQQEQTLRMLKETRTQMLNIKQKERAKAIAKKGKSKVFKTADEAYDSDKSLEEMINNRKKE